MTLELEQRGHSQTPTAPSCLGRQWDFGVQGPRAPFVAFVLGFVQHKTLCWRRGCIHQFVPGSSTGVPLQESCSSGDTRGAVPRAGSPPQALHARGLADGAAAAMPQR